MVHVLRAETTMKRHHSLGAYLLVIALAAGTAGAPETTTTTTTPRLRGRQLCPNPRGKPPPGRVDSKRQLTDLRRVMAMQSYDQGLPVDAYIVTSDDDHQSEYVASRDHRRAFISGFSGSNGVAVVTQMGAALWTDGRYFLQADRQLDCNWELMRVGQADALTHTEWLAQKLRSESRIGADPRLIANHVWETLGKELESINMSLVEMPENLVDKIWTTGRPAYSYYEAFILNITYAGRSWESKVEDLRLDLEYFGADAMIVTSLDEVAWLFNIRGRDIKYTPVLRAYAIVSRKEIHMFVNENKLNGAIKRQLRTNKCLNNLCVRVHPYDDVFSDLHTMTQSWSKVLLPAPCVYDQGASHAIYVEVPQQKRLPKASPIIFMKARKNTVEIHGMRNAHIRDATAVCDFLAYMEDKMAEGMNWTEISVAKTIDEFRHEQNLSWGLSFTTIAGFGPNGALPHYQPSKATNLQIDNSSTLVLDSGGQYLDGTTDVTRTLHFGKPSEFQRDIYTRVLMGHIQLASLVFPPTVQTSNIDVLARGPLWKIGLDFEHGTGHGIGSFLSVHESPINILYREGNFTFEKGNFFSDEPGYYQQGHFGVRLENILEVEERQTRHKSEHQFMGFRATTLVPYEPKLINVAMLTNEHRRWLNEYNSQIRIKVGAELKQQKRMRGFHWMMSKTGYIPEHCVIRSAAGRSNEPTRLLTSVITVVLVIGRISAFHGQFWL